MPFDIQELRQAAGDSRLGRLWRWGRSPLGIAAILQAPEDVSKADAARALFPEVTPEMVEACRLNLLNNGRFFEELNRRYVGKRHRRTNCDGWQELLYILVRFAKPIIVLETGVFDGLSSAVILQALEDNAVGTLISVDLPARTAIEGSTDRMTDSALPAGGSPGWVVPDYLRHRFRLVEGDSREWLPKLLGEYPKLDIFFHDSLHTFEHQYFEYSTAWPHIVPGGLLLSDDIFFNSAFHQFCKQNAKRYVHVEGFGAIRK
ncbi:MAG: class I SAM-dependent methyltransferase [Terriglobales bacterium]